MENYTHNTLNWKEIGQRFKTVRKNRNLSQEEMGKLSNQLRQAITRYENGLQPASINYALFLRNEFGTSFDWLYDGDMVERQYKDIQQKKTFDLQTIGTRLKAIRVDKGLNKEEFGRVIGITGQAVAQFENCI
ncbi:MAG: hypothetical protein C4617_03230 [Candidatus Liberibacter europaeus]|uniref:HTH cro/C1-type domain-containing protein n=1 Tax=Candidatus Liberibacter europaeus TaxID=744859 RepID=A0A2T4VYH4_9HYPH|nr:hypothetical protein [Candidatus Liberibacter europaeus]PTL86820.1 MAG: hypothetical protein C4617_03230 [Candidatus Liberibacter europaeus]